MPTDCFHGFLCHIQFHSASQLGLKGQGTKGRYGMHNPLNCKQLHDKIQNETEENCMTSVCTCIRDV